MPATGPTAPAGPTVTGPEAAAAARPATPGQLSADSPSGAIHYVVIAAGQFHLRGFAPSRAAADQIVATGGQRWGAANVVDELLIDPTVPVATDATMPVHVNDVIPFDPSSATIGSAYHRLLDQVVALLKDNPTLKVHAIARTDATGSAQANLRLSQIRFEAVCDYPVDAGVDRVQVIRNSRGESDAMATDDPAAASQQRSVQLVVGVSPPANH